MLLAALGSPWAAPPAGAQAADPPTEAQRASASELYEKALVEYNLGEIRSAYLHLKNALLQDPFQLSAHLLLGKIYLEFGEGDKAEKELLIADGLGAHASLTLVPLARAYLLQGKSEQLLAELFPLGTLPEEDAELLALRGQAHLRLDQLYEAQRAFEQAGERNPNNLSAILGRVQVLLGRGEVNEADFYVRRAVEAAPDNPNAWFLKGTLARNLGDIQSALRDFERATQALPAFLPAQIGRVSALLDLGRYDQAMAAAEETAKLYPRDPRTLYLKALVQARMQQPERAEESLKSAELLLSQLPRELIDGHAPTLLLAGMVSYSLKRWAQAESYLSLYLQKFPDSVGPRTLLAQIALDKRLTQEAIKLLEPALGLAPNDAKVLSLLAEAYMRDGQHIKASRLLQDVIDSEEDSVVLRTQRAVNAYGLGRKDQALEDLGAVFDAHPELENAGATLVVMSLKDRRFDEALNAAKRLIEEHPDNLTYLNLYGVSALAAGDNAAARWAFDLALALDWRFVPAQLNLAELELREGRLDAAQKRLEVLLTRQSDHVAAMLLLARAYEAGGREQEARGLAERAMGEDPTSIPVAVYLSSLLLEMKDPAEALRVAESMEVRAANPDDVDLLAALSRAYIANGQRSTAQVVLQRGSSLAGYDAAKLMEIAALQRQAGDLQGARWSLEKAEQGQPKFLPTRIKLGELYTEIGKFELATEVANALRADFPREPYGDHLLGTIAQARGNLEEALASYRAALALRPSPVLAVRVYEALRAAEGLDAGVAFLTDWVKAHPEDQVARQALAEGLYLDGRIGEARVLYEEALAQSPDNPMLLNNLALIYAREGNPQAIDHARRAHALLPSAPELADTLGWVMVLEGQLSEGLKFLRDAQSRAANDPGTRYHIAYALDRLGRQDEALRELKSAFASDEPFPERDDAQELRQRLEQGGDETQDPGVARAAPPGE
jgi:putative PEP-CTERM system TPR-repeat lipoprotein